MKRTGHLFEKLIDHDNLLKAITRVNASHHYIGKGNARRVNQTTAWVETTKEERIEELRQIIVDGFVQKEVRRFRLRDANS